VSSILIVDDDPHLRQSFEKLLSEEDYKVRTASSGDEAIEGEMENVIAGKKTSLQGLDDAVKKGNELLKEFAAMYK